MVGRRVRIGANVTIRDSHIWNDVVIEDGAVRKQATHGSIQGCMHLFV